MRSSIATVVSGAALIGLIGGCAEQQQPAAGAPPPYATAAPPPAYAAAPPPPPAAAPPPQMAAAPPPGAPPPPEAIVGAPPPNGCNLNTGTNVNAVAAPLVGAAIGAAAGGGGLRSLFGAAIGAAAGGAIAASLDAECHQYVVQYTLQLAAIEDARLARERAAAEAREREEAAAAAAAEQQRQFEAARAHEAEVARLRARQQAAARPTYKAAVWKTANGTSGTIQPLSHETDPAGKLVCYSVSDAQAEKGREPGAGAAQRYCRAADGSWKLAAR